MKPIDITSDFCAEHNEDSNKKVPKFKVGGHVRISKYKNIFAKGDGQKKFLLLVKLKIQLLGLIQLVTRMVKKLLEAFTKKNCKRLVKKSLEQKDKLKEKVMNSTLNGKDMTIHLIVGQIKKTLYENESTLS